MRIRLRCRPSFSRSSRRGRLTTFGRSRGIYSFVARIGVGMSHPSHFLSLPTTSQIVFSMVHRWEVTGLAIMAKRKRFMCLSFREVLSLLVGLSVRHYE